MLLSTSQDGVDDVERVEFGMDERKTFETQQNVAFTGFVSQMFSTVVFGLRRRCFGSGRKRRERFGDLFADLIDI